MAMFNVNRDVLVKLTDEGRKILREQHTELYRHANLKGISTPEYLPKKEDADGWSKWQLWELMQAFGAHLYNGCKVPFETTIQIPTLCSLSDATSN